MTLERIYSNGQIVAILESKKSGEIARIYAVQESRGYQTKYQHKTFFWFVPENSNGTLSNNIKGITRDARRKNIPLYSNVTICNDGLWKKFIN